MFKKGANKENVNPSSNVSIPGKAHSETAKKNIVSNNETVSKSSAMKETKVNEQRAKISPPNCLATMKTLSVARLIQAVTTNQNRIKEVNQTETENKSPWCLADFKVGRPLGTGKFGNTYSAQAIAAKYSVALKVMSKRQISLENMEQVCRAIIIQSKIKSPNILQLYGYFEDASNIYTILEYAREGNLYMRMRNQPGKRFDEICTAKYVHSISKAVDVLHKWHIHRNIKPENLFLTDNGELKLADFGLFVRDSKKMAARGPMSYSAPECEFTLFFISFLRLKFHSNVYIFFSSTRWGSSYVPCRFVVNWYVCHICPYRI